MKKYHLHTTLTSKHWELLNKYTEKFGTQQKVLELAIESLEKEKQSSVLPPEEQIWLSIKKLGNTCLLHKALFQELFRTADNGRFNELITALKLAEYQLIVYLQKPLKECSLKEVMDAIIITSNATNFLDEIKYTDDGDHYTLKVSHSMVIRGKEYSNLFKLFFGTLFEAYGAKTESNISGNNIFMKVYKNSQ